MDKDILELIPQRKPIVMVDGFTGIGDDNVSRTSFAVTADNIFVDDGVFSECGIIEHIAQSAAARVGSEFASRGEDIPIGYIGAVNDFRLATHPKTGDVLETEIEVIQKVMNISLISARTYVDGQEAASCKMKIFLAENEAE